MRHWLQSLLGIDVVLSHLHDLRNLRIEDNKRINASIEVHNQALARIIRQLTPVMIRVMAKLSWPEVDPKNKAESDLIASQIMRELITEHLTSKDSKDV